MATVSAPRATAARGALHSEPCRVCGRAADRVHQLTVLGRLPVGYYFCPHCGFMQTERPYWLEEAYSSAIAASDTGLVMRNVALAARLAAVLHSTFGREATFVDAGGGYGMLTRLMRDLGFDYYWDDPYCTNLFASGHEAGDRARFDAVTAFEVMEHVSDPLQFVRDTLARFGARTFVFSTQLFEGAPPAPGAWPYYSPETGQHVAFYQRRTLDHLAAALGMRAHSAGFFHVITDRDNLPAWKFRALAGRWSVALTPWIRRRRGGLTVRDRDRALARLRERPGHPDPSLGQSR